MDDRCESFRRHLEVFDGSVFCPHERSRPRLPIVDRSISWFSEKRGHVAPAQVLAAFTPVRRRHAAVPRRALFGDGEVG
jgi:hypothetical protein